METRDFYFVRRTLANDYLRDTGFTKEILDATRYEQRSDAEEAALQLARSDKVLAQPRALETVQIKITLNEVSAMWQRY